MKRTNYIKRSVRHRRIRARLSGTAICPRLSVFRSGKHLFVQLIDDVSGRTLVAVSDCGPVVKEEAPTLGKAEVGVPTASVGRKGGRKEQLAFVLGKMIAEKAKEKGITKVVFDRGGYAYHGRVKAVADGAREGGLQF